MITIDLLKHEQDQADEIIDRLWKQMHVHISRDQLLTLDQIRYIFMRISELATEVNND